ncbi:MAG: hypothetical protein WKG07_37820 [Hymenobacter sp.]
MLRSFLLLLVLLPHPRGRAARGRPLPLSRYPLLPGARFGADV